MTSIVRLSTSLFALGLCAGLVLGSRPAAQAGVLIPMTDRRAHVFDDARGLLYVTTSAGTVERYDVAQAQFLAPYVVGGSPRALDLTDDGAFLYVANAAASSNTGFVTRIELATGALVTHNFTTASGELGSWDLAIAANGKAVFSTTGSASFVQLRELDLATGVIQSVPFSGVFDRETRIVAGGDRSALFLMETLSGPPPVALYSAATGFLTEGHSSGDSTRDLISISADGSLLAQEFGSSAVRIMDTAFQLVTTLPTRPAGLIFDSVRDRLYVADLQTLELVAFETQGFTELFRRAGAMDTFSDDFTTGEMSIDRDARYVFLSAFGGILMFDLGPVLPELADLQPNRFAFDLGGAPPPEVLVHGRFFTHGANTTVTIGGVPATVLGVVDDRTLRVELPPGVPGPADVVLENSAGRVELPHAFFYTPALDAAQAGPGAELELELKLAGDQSVFLLFGLPPAVPRTLAPFGGQLCLTHPLLLLRLPAWPLDTLDLTFDVPDDPALIGLEILLQALVGPRPLDARSAFTNCRSVVLQ